jgi:hypothetical protein
MRMVSGPAAGYQRQRSCRQLVGAYGVKVALVFTVDGTNLALTAARKRWCSG